MNRFDVKGYWESRLRSNYNLEGVGYKQLGRYFNHWQYRLRKYVFKCGMRHIGDSLKAKDVLDIGSGTGFYIDRWQEQRVHSISGLDITEIAVQSLAEKYPQHTFYCLNIGDEINSLKDKQFDIISAFDVLFHIVDDVQFEKAIHNIAALLKSDGYFICSDFFLHNSKRYSIAHQVSRSLDEYTDTLDRAGMEIAYRFPMFVLMNIPIDTQNPFPLFAWRVFAKILSLHELVGLVVGAVLYPLELLCVSTIKESASTEIMICRKKNSKDS